MKIEIYKNSVWSGEGRLVKGGEIVDCAANLTETVYEAIEEAIFDHLSDCTVGDDEYSWEIEED